MGDWIGLGIVVLVIASSVFGVWKLIAPRKPISDVEFERRVRENPGVLSSSVMGLQKILEPGAAKSVEVQQDLRGGRYNKKQARGDGDHELKS